MVVLADVIMLYYQKPLCVNQRKQNNASGGQGLRPCTHFC